MTIYDFFCLMIRHAVATRCLAKDLVQFFYIYWFKCFATLFYLSLIITTYFSLPLFSPGPLQLFSSPFLALQPYVFLLSYLIIKTCIFRLLFYVLKVKITNKPKSPKPNTFSFIRNLYPVNESSCSVITLEW